jgi:hypothetical protein
MKFAEVIKWKFSGPRIPTVFFLFSILLGLLVIISGCSNDLDLRMLTTSVSYDLNIQTNETLSNVTFYIPLPVKDGKPVVGERVLQESDFTTNGFQAKFERDPKGWEPKITTYQIPGEDPWFVKITAEKIIPQQNSNWQYSVVISNSSSISGPSMFMDTRYPMGNASIILPKVGFSPISPIDSQSNSLYALKYEEVRIPHFTEIYVDYSASPSTKVQIASILQQGNWWKEYDDSSNGNSCSEYVTWEHVGEAHGWYQAKDVLYAGRGVYPNLSSPEWQKVIEASSPGK